MSECSQQVLDLILSGLSAIRGDNLERARAAFRGLPDSAMDSLYGESGKTRREILAEYEGHARMVDAASQWVRDNLAVRS